MCKLFILLITFFSINLQAACVFDADAIVFAPSIVEKIATTDGYKRSFQLINTNSTSAFPIVQSLKIRCIKEEGIEYEVILKKIHDNSDSCFNTYYQCHSSLTLSNSGKEIIENNTTVFCFYYTKRKECN